MRASSSMEAGAERLRPIHRRETARERTRDFARIASMHDLVFVDHAAARRSIEASRRRFEFLSVERRLLSTGDLSGEIRSLSRARDGFGKNRALASSRHISPFLRDRSPSRRDDAPRGSSRRFRKPFSDSPRRVRPGDAPMRRPNRCDPFRLRASAFAGSNAASVGFGGSRQLVSGVPRMASANIGGARRYPPLRAPASLATTSVLLRRTII